MVDVKFEKKLQQDVTLKDVKECAKLQNMQFFKWGRIYMQRVSQSEWAIVLKMAGESIPDYGSKEKEKEDYNDD